ncbi:cysteine hydrolase [Vibrio profundum]|uniref:cysteine hydrolase n=1 Tax=Vibrio profundum TaxID=2910247 RepID=UPI003D11F751
MENQFLIPNQTALILIEYQNEWVSERGSLRNKLVVDDEQFELAIEHSKQVLSAARENDLSVVHVLLKPDKEYRMFGQAKHGLRSAIAQNKTWQGYQGEIHPDFMPKENEHVITERIGASAFSGSNLDCFLRNNGLKNLMLIGFATHVCVESTLRSSHDLGYNTFVITEATGAFTNEQKAYFSQDVVNHFGIEISVADLLPLVSKLRRQNGTKS